MGLVVMVVVLFLVGVVVGVGKLWWRMGCWCWMGGGGVWNWAVVVDWCWWCMIVGLVVAWVVGWHVAHQGWVLGESSLYAVGTGQFGLGCRRGGRLSGDHVSGCCVFVGKAFFCMIMIL